MKISEQFIFRLAAIVMLSWVASAAGVEYYVSSEGDDSRSGLSVNESWGTVERLNRVDLEPGDRVLFEGGKEFRGNLLLTSEDAGTVQRPVVVTSYGGSRATLLAGNGCGIRVMNMGGIEIRRLSVRGSGWTSRTPFGRWITRVIRSRWERGSLAPAVSVTARKPGRST